MIVHIDKLIRHLKSQLSTAKHLQSDFVYITKREAEACLELAESQELIKERDLCRVLFNRCQAVCGGSMCMCCLIRAECEAMRGSKDDNKTDGKKV